MKNRMSIARGCCSDIGIFARSNSESGDVIVNTVTSTFRSDTPLAATLTGVILNTYAGGGSGENIQWSFTTDFEATFIEADENGRRYLLEIESTLEMTETTSTAFGVPAEPYSITVDFPANAPRIPSSLGDVVTVNRQEERYLGEFLQVTPFRFGVEHLGDANNQRLLMRVYEL